MLFFHYIRFTIFNYFLQCRIQVTKQIISFLTVDVVSNFLKSCGKMTNTSQTQFI